MHKQPRNVITRRFPTFAWGGAYERYARAWVERNHWRIKHYIGGKDDALQECAIIFCRCAAIYKGKVSEPKHMMSLFKIALVNDFNTFAKRDTQQRDLILEPEIEESFEVRLAKAALTRGSDEAISVVNAILSAPEHLISLVFCNGEQAGLNRRIKRFFKGISASEHDIAAELKDLLN